MVSIFHRGRIPFVGRRVELDRLTQHRARLEGNHDRGRHLVLIEGFSGVGKTALVEKFLSNLDQDGRSFTPHGAYSAHLRRSALAPLLDALDELLIGRFAQRRMRTLFTDPTYHLLLARLPMLCNAIGFDSHTTTSPPASPETLAALIASVLAQLARSRPVVLMLDDVQYMPEEDLRALSTLNGSLRNAPVLILATLHREVAEAERIRESVKPLLVDHFHMSPLQVQEIAELLSEIYGPRVSAQLAADLAVASEGVPLRAIELMRKLEECTVLVQEAKGGWVLSAGYHPGLLARESTSVEKVQRLDPAERLVLLLLGCAGGQAGRGELLGWAEMLAHPHNIEVMRALPGVLERLEKSLLIKPVFSNPEQVTFAHESILDAQRQLRSQHEICMVAQMIVARPELRRVGYRWTYDRELFDLLFETLPPAGAQERQELMESLIGTTSLYADGWDNTHRIQVYQMILAKREWLTTREYADTLVQTITWAHLYTRFAQSIPWAEELYELTLSDRSCSDLRAEACMLLASARFHNDRTADVSDLLQEAWRALEKIEDGLVRMRTEMQITRNRATLVPVGEPREAVRQGRRVIFLAEQLGIEDEKYNILPDLMIRSARLRQEEDLRFFCNELLKAIRDPGAPLPPFTVVSSGVRAALIYGDYFLARSIFEGWGRRSAPLTTTDFVAYSYLTALFAFADGEPLVAAETAMNAREEVIRYRSRSTQLTWELAYNYAGLQVQLVPYMLAAGRYMEAFGLAEAMLIEIESAMLPLPDVTLVLNLYRKWLRWRCLLPVDAQVSLSWPTLPLPLEGGSDRINTTYDPTVAHPAAKEFRKYYEEVIGHASPPPRFTAELLLASVECAEGNYERALAAIDRAIAANEQLYDWQKELECRASAITVKLRWGRGEPERAATLAESALEESRILFSMMSEKGMATRLSQLTVLFKEDAALISGAPYRDFVGQLERLGLNANAAANNVVRNSRTQESGPIDRVRLFLMGPLRLMLPHSYMELGDTAFGREAARMLLTALVVAEVLDRVPTREELSAWVVPKARTEQQKKGVYNAATAVRNALGSPNCIQLVGAGIPELNTNLDLEGSVWVDALEIIRAVRRAADLERREEIGTAFDNYQHALQLARKGDFAADVYADWVEAARDRLREVVREAALAVGRIALRSGLYSAGIDAISTQLTRDPFDEEAHRYLIRLYNEQGNRSAALKQIENCRKLILREFGVELEPETQRLRQEIMEMREEVSGE